MSWIQDKQCKSVVIDSRLKLRIEREFQTQSRYKERRGRARLGSVNAPSNSSYSG